MVSTIDNSNFSSEWLISTLKEVDPKFDAVSQVKSVKEISGGKGFASKVYFCDLGSSSVVLKVPESGKLEELCKPDESQAAGLPSICLSHNREVDFYTDFAPMNLIQLPKMYKTAKFGADGQGNAFLLMEYLGDRADLDSLVDGFNRHQLLSIARDLARFQAHFLKLEDNSWTRKFHKEIPEATVSIMKDLLVKFKDIKPEIYSKGVDQLLPYVGNREFVNFSSFSAHKSLNIAPVMVHGNLWTNNIFWKTNEKDGSVGNEVEAYIDWQLAHAGSLTTDLAEVLTICTEADVRRQYTEEVLEEYYRTLTKELGKEPSFTFEQVKKLYDLTFHSQCWNLLFAVVFHPAMLTQLPESIREVQLEKLQSRAKFAMDDCIASLNKLPKEFEKLSVA